MKAKETTQKAQQTPFIEKFETVAQMMQTIKGRKFCDKNIGETEYSQQTGEYYERWTRTKNFTEAVEILKHGYPEGLKGMKSAQLKLKTANQGEAPKNQIKNDFTGFAPNVGAYLAGIPTNMLTIHKAPEAKKVINIYINTSIIYDKDESYFYTAGANILTLINSLEKRGINTEIIIVCSCTDFKNFGIMQLTIKKAGERFNPLRLSFPLCHPAFFRRIFFRWIETAPLKITGRARYKHVTNTADVNSLLNLKANEIITDTDQAQEFETLKETAEKINIL